MGRTLVRKAVAVVASAAVAVAIVGADGHSAAAGSEKWPAPRTLLTARGGIDFFAQDGSWIAWSDSSQPCPRLIQLRNLATNRTYPLLGRPSRTCDATSVDSRGALARDRVLWVAVDGGITQNCYSILTAALGTRERRLGEYSCVFHDDGVLEFAAAGDGPTLVYSAYTVHRVGQRPSLVPGITGANAVAASGQRFALARRVERGDGYEYVVEARTWTSGQILFSFTRPEVHALALDRGAARSTRPRAGWDPHRDRAV
jgi:hypothetical protein